MAKKPKTSDREATWVRLALGLGTIAAGAATLAVTLVLRRDRLSAGHAAPDLAADAPEAERAPEHFRPDPTSVPTAAEREALRPATGPVPSMVNPRGTGFAVGGDIA